MATHKMSATVTYKRWESMKYRCSPGGVYAGKVKVDPAWNSFIGFYKDMGDCPEGMTLDRIDNSKGYEKSNCRWVDMHTQYRNRTNNRWFTLNGETKILTDWAREYGLNSALVERRIRKGVPLEQALTTPARKYRKSISTL